MSPITGPQFVGGAMMGRPTPNQSTSAMGTFTGGASGIDNSDIEKRDDFSGFYTPLTDFTPTVTQDMLDDRANRQHDLYDASQHGAVTKGAMYDALGAQQDIAFGRDQGMAQIRAKSLADQAAQFGADIQSQEQTLAQSGLSDQQKAVASAMQQRTQSGAETDLMSNLAVQASERQRQAVGDLASQSVAMRGVEQAEEYMELQDKWKLAEEELDWVLAAQDDAQFAAQYGLNREELAQRAQELPGIIAQRRAAVVSQDYLNFDTALSTLDPTSGSYMEDAKDAFFTNMSMFTEDEKQTMWDAMDLTEMVTRAFDAQENNALTELGDHLFTQDINQYITESTFDADGNEIPGGLNFFDADGNFKDPAMERAGLTAFYGAMGGSIVGSPEIQDENDLIEAWNNGTLSPEAEASIKSYINGTADDYIRSADSLAFSAVQGDINAMLADGSISQEQADEMLAGLQFAQELNLFGNNIPSFDDQGNLIFKDAAGNVIAFKGVDADVRINDTDMILRSGAEPSPLPDWTGDIKPGETMKDPGGAELAYSLSDDGDTMTHTQLGGKPTKYYKIGDSWYAENQLETVETPDTQDIADDQVDPTTQEIPSGVSPGDYFVAPDGTFRQVTGDGVSIEANPSTMDAGSIFDFVDGAPDGSVSPEMYSELADGLLKSPLDETQIRKLAANPELMASFRDNATASSDKGWNTQSGRTASARQTYNGSVGDIISEGDDKLISDKWWNTHGGRTASARQTYNGSGGDIIPEGDDKLIIVSVENVARDQPVGQDYGQAVTTLNLRTGEFDTETRYGSGNRDRS